MNPIFVKRKDVSKITTLSSSTIDRLEKEGQFPKRQKITDSRVGWLYSEISDWATSRNNSFSHS